MIVDGWTILAVFVAGGLLVWQLYPYFDNKKK